jgi:hypothetical protein
MSSLKHRLSSRVPAKRGLRRKAWRNLLVAGVNQALEAGLFSLDGSAPTDRQQVEAAVTIADMPAVVTIRDIGFDELAVSVHLYPTPTGGRWTFGSHWPASFARTACVANASGWLERRNGPYLQDSLPKLTTPNWILPTLAKLDVEPNGFKDHGRFVL